MTNSGYENLALSMIEDGRRPETATLLCQAQWLRDLASTLEDQAFDLERRHSPVGSTATAEGLMEALKRVYGE